MLVKEKREDKIEEREESTPKLFPLYSLLPCKVRRRLKALKKIQQQTVIIEGKFFYDVHKLECKYMDKFSKLYKKREKIIEGTLEPTNSDCEFEDGTESPDETDLDLKKQRRKLTLPFKMSRKTKGIPGFWLTALRNIELLRTMITPHDEPILEYLINITLDLKEPLSYTLSFWFSANPYFKNRVLTKTYDLEWTVEGVPWAYKGAKLTNVTGCTIQWNEGMDVTKKEVVEMTGKKMATGKKKTIYYGSFFSFFETPTLPNEDDPSFDKAMCERQIDFFRAVVIRETLIPKAVLYYTGEAPDYNEHIEESENNAQSKKEISKSIHHSKLKTEPSK